MKLLNSLYHISDKSSMAGTVQYDILLDTSHSIWQAHFPGNPITPGVFIIQMAKELLEHHLDKSLLIQKVKNVKFPSVISPLETPAVSCVFVHIITDNATRTCQSQVQLQAGKRVLARLSFTCKYQ